jgi:hypothetical protein
MLLKEQSQVIRLQRLSQPFRIADARARERSKFFLVIFTSRAYFVLQGMAFEGVPLSKLGAI